MTGIAIIGAGPAGLMAAEHLAGLGHAVTIYDRMAQPGRKLLLAGRGGLNLTHSESAEIFGARYGAARDWLAPALAAFPPTAVAAWCEGLGQPVFTGSSGRIFPKTFTASPLLRAWLRRLADLGVSFAPRHRWPGFGPSRALRFAMPDGEITVSPAATLLALGGASWPRMGSDGAWVDILAAENVAISPLRPSNCGALIAWSALLRDRWAGTPLKRIMLSIGVQYASGEAMITKTGLEGGPVYALSRPLRVALDRDGTASLLLDLLPDHAAPALADVLDGPRGSHSLSNFLRRKTSLAPAAIALVQEALHRPAPPQPLSRLVKALPLQVTALAPIDRAISTAGGIARQAVDENFMLRAMPGVFAAGEMLDWEAPTGGYLLQACFSTGFAAARGIASWLTT